MVFVIQKKSMNRLLFSINRYIENNNLFIKYKKNNIRSGNIFGGKKEISMRKIICITIVCLAIVSCMDDNSDVGNMLVDSSFKSVFTDTCKVSMGTIFIDSIETRGDSIFQLGVMVSEDWGKVKASYFAEYLLSDFNGNNGKTYVFDSLIVSFKPSGNYWGDTLSIQNVNIHKLKKPISLVNGESLYNNSNVQIEEEPIARFSYINEPSSGNTITARLPDDLGLKLLNDLLDNSDVFTSQERFRDYLPGFAFVPEDDCTCISGFLMNDSTMNMILCYHALDDIEEELNLKFKINSEYSYTRVEHDKSGTLLENIKGGRINPSMSDTMQNKAFIQGLTGFYNTIDFPYINNIKSQGDIITIEEAILYLYPLRGTYGNNNQLPMELFLFVADENNMSQEIIYDPSGTNIQNGELVYDTENKLNTYYSFDITDFMKNNLGTWGMTREKLLLSMDGSTFETTFNQVIWDCDNKQTGNSYVKVDIKYQIYKKK